MRKLSAAETELVKLVAQNALRFRQEAGLSQEVASLRTGLGAAAIRRYETGRARIDSLALKRLGDAYGHTVDHFFMTDPPAAPPPPRVFMALSWQDDATKPEGPLREIYESTLREIAEKNLTISRLLREQESTPATKGEIDGAGVDTRKAPSKSRSTKK